MKTKYERMNRREKRELINNYKKNNTIIYKKIRNMFILCYIGFIYSIISFLYDYIIKYSKLNYIIDIIIFIGCILVLYRTNILKKDLLNNYALKK